MGARMNTSWLALIAVGAIAASVPAQSQQTQPTPAELAQRSARLAAFRAFAEPYLGEWACAIEEYDEKGKVVWSDTQRRVFSFTMSRHFLEERAILKRPDGTEYEGGLHLTTWDPASDRIVQHGFWIPQQPDPLFRIEGRASGRDFTGEMNLRQESGGYVRRGLEMRWHGPDRWVLEAIGVRPDGSRFVKERLSYTRTGKPA